MGDVAAARAKLGLDADQFKALRAFLDGKTFGLKIVCDHTHARTEEWAGRMGVDMEALVDALKTWGGACDCKVVANVTPDKFGW
ncbi:MAG TPA: DUF2695 domain-containing protein [Planctomycetota bacterium]|jgi:hypothetical protein|nr:DUF2695 domain-containing protein [Planctomycetota bacterium]